MPKKKHIEEDRTVDLLAKMLVFQLHTLGIPQERIATTVGKQTVWVNDLLKGISKGGKSHGNQRKAKKTNGRSHG